MKKTFLGVAILLAIPAMVAAQTASSTATTITSLKKTLDLPCIQKAAEKRESAIIVAETKFASSSLAAFTARKTEIVAAWGMTETKARHEARTAAWKKFDITMKLTRSTAKTEKLSAWVTYQADQNACGVKDVVEKALISETN